MTAWAARVHRKHGQHATAWYAGDVMRGSAFAVVLALLPTLPACQVVFSIEGSGADASTIDAGADAVPGTRRVRLREWRVGPDLPSDDMFPLPAAQETVVDWQGWDAPPSIDGVAVRVLDSAGAELALTRSADGFSFVFNSPDSVHLQVRRGPVTVNEFITAAEDVDLLLRAWGPLDSERVYGTGELTFSGLPTTLPADRYYVASTGVRSFSFAKPAGSQEAALTWGDVRPAFGAPSVLNADRGDRLYLLLFQRTADTVETYALTWARGFAQDAGIQNETIVANAGFDMLAGREQKAATLNFDANATAQALDQVAPYSNNPDGWGQQAFYAQVRSTALPQVSHGAGLPVFLRETNLAATMSARNVPYSNPFPGESDLGVWTAYRFREYMLNGWSSGLRADAAYLISAPIVEGSAEVSSTIPMIGPIVVDGALYNDRTEASSVPFGTVVRVSVASQVAAAQYAMFDDVTFSLEVTRVEVVAGVPERVSLWTTFSDDPEFTLPGELFEPGQIYVLLARARRGPPRLATGDLASTPTKLEGAVFTSPPLIAETQ